MPVNRKYYVCLICVAFYYFIVLNILKAAECLFFPSRASGVKGGTLKFMHFSVHFKLNISSVCVCS